jgi:SAM-dependent methyltransferase
LDLNCTFIHSDIYELPQKFHEQFDLVYTSYGVLAWLPDIRKWGEVVSHFLKPGGVFYIVEIHPFSYMLDDWKMEKAELKLRYSYFHSREPLVFETAGTYAEPDADIKANVQYEWAHSMGDIINALVDVGLSIDFLHEFDYTVFRQVEFLERKGRLFYLPEEMPKVPLLFSLKARKGV